MRKLQKIIVANCVILQLKCFILQRGIVMFQYFFSQQYENIFEKKPRLVRLDYITGSVEWKHSYHMHEHTELIYISEDECIFTMDFVEYPRRAGDIMVIEPGQIHSMLSNTGVIWSFIIRDFKIRGLKENTILHAGTSPLFNAGEFRQSIESIVSTIDILKHNTNNTSVYTCHTLMAVLVAMYYDIFQNARKVDPARPHLFINNILTFLNENYMQHITLQDLAEQFNVSPSYISHEFSKEYHISPINYMIERRLNQAKVLLINSGDNIADIAQKVGYSDVNHFIKLFIKRVGSKPTEYRDYYRHKQDL